jgi:hypothetical protein
MLTRLASASRSSPSILMRGFALAVALIAEGRLERGELVDDETGDGLAWYRLSNRAYESYARVAAEQTALADWN